MADVFCSVVSYRDPAVVDTVRGLLADPGLRVRVGVVLQDDGAAIERRLRDLEHVDMITVPSRDARGASWARALSQSLYEGERWYYMADAHTQGHDPGWALELARQSDLVGPRAVLSTYEIGAGTDRTGRATVMGLKRFDERDGLRGPGIIRRLAWFSGRPAPARRLSAHHLWAPGQWVEDVPIDPRIYFGAEEQTLALRSWTHGYDLFHPCKSLCMHLYRVEGGHKPPRHAQDHPNWPELRKRSDRRMATLYGWATGDLGVYGLGSVRSRQDFEQWAGVDFRARTYTDEAAWRSLMKP